MKKISCFVLIGFMLFAALGCVKDTTLTTTDSVNSSTTSTTSTNTPTTSTIISTDETVEVYLDLSVLTSPVSLSESEFLSYINFDLVCGGDCTITGNYNLTTVGTTEVSILCDDIQYRLDIHTYDSPIIFVTLEEDVYPVNTTVEDIEENVVITNMIYSNYEIVIDPGMADFSALGNYTIYVKLYVEDEIYNINAFEIQVQNGEAPVIGGIQNFYLPLHSSPEDYLDGITFTDSDGTIVDSSYSTNVNYDVSGLYSLTYAAEDNLGNITYGYANIVVGDYVQEYAFNFEELLSAEQLVTLNDYVNLLRIFSPYDGGIQNLLTQNDKIININYFESITNRPIRLDELQTLMDYLDLLKFRDAFILEQIYGAESASQNEILIDAYYDMMWIAYQNINIRQLVNLESNPEYNYFDSPLSIYEWMRMYAQGMNALCLLSPIQKQAIELYASLNGVQFSEGLLRLKLYMDYELKELSEYYALQGQYILYPCELDQEMTTSDFALIQEYRDAYALRSYELAIQYPYVTLSLETYRTIYDLALENQRARAVYGTWTFSTQTVDFIPTQRTLTTEELNAIQLALDTITPIRRNINSETPDETYLSTLESIRFEYYTLYKYVNSTFLSSLLTFDQDAMEGLLQRALTQADIDAINYFRTNYIGSLSIEQRVRDFFNDETSSFEYLLRQYLLFYQILGKLDSFSQEDYDAILSLVHSGIIDSEMFLYGITREYDEFVSMFFWNVTEENNLLLIQRLYQMDWRVFFTEVYPTQLRFQYTLLEYYQTTMYEGAFHIINDLCPDPMMVFQGIQDGIPAQDFPYEGDPEQYDHFVEAYDSIAFLMNMQRISVVVSTSSVPTQNTILTDWYFMSNVAQYAYENALSINTLLMEIDLSELSGDVPVFEYVSVFRNAYFNLNIEYYVDEVFSHSDTQWQYSILDYYVVFNEMKPSGELNVIEVLQEIEDGPISDTLDYVKTSLYQTLRSDYLKDLLANRLNMDASLFSDELCIALQTLFSSIPMESIGSLQYNLGNVMFINYWYEQGTFTQAVSNEIEQFIRQLILLNRDGFAADLITDNEYVALTVSLLNQNQNQYGEINFLYHWNASHWSLSTDEIHVYEYFHLMQDVDLEMQTLVNQTYMDGFHEKAIMLLKVYHEMENGYFQVSEILNLFDSSLEADVRLCIDEVFDAFFADQYVDRIITSLPQALTAEQRVTLRNYVLHVGVEFGGWNYVYNALNLFVKVNQAILLSADDKEAANWILSDLISKELNRAIYESVQNDTHVYLVTAHFVDADTLSAMEDVCWMIIDDDLSFTELINGWNVAVGLEVLDAQQQSTYDIAQGKLNELDSRIDAVIQAILTGEYQPL